MEMRGQNDAEYRALLIASAVCRLCSSQRVRMLLTTLMQIRVAVNRESGDRKSGRRPGNRDVQVYWIIGSACCTAYKAGNKGDTKE
jgi:hypothetical protein